MKISRNTALEIFDLKEGFTKEALKRSYRRLAKIVHPDSGGDPKLFILVETCKQILEGKIDQENTESGEDISRKKQNRRQDNRERGNIRVSMMEEEYDFLEIYERRYNILDIEATVIVYIYPYLRNNLLKSYTILMTVPYRSFKDLGFVHLSKTIEIPQEIRYFRNFKIRVEFLGDTYSFNKVSRKKLDILIKRKKYKYAPCLTSILELHFKF